MEYSKHIHLNVVYCPLSNSHFNDTREIRSKTTVVTCLLTLLLTNHAWQFVPVSLDTDPIALFALCILDR